MPSLPSSQIEETIPSLSDDLMLMIFNELTTEERAPLGTTCKRFRELDFALGKKHFDSIEVEWIWPWLDIKGIAASSVYAIQIYFTSGTSAATFPDMRLFRNAQTETLKIKHTHTICSPTHLELFAGIFKQIRFTKLWCTSQCQLNCFENLFRSLIEGRNLQCAQIYVNFTSYLLSREESSKNAIVAWRAREMLMKLPKLDKFKLIMHVPGKIIGNAALLHLISNVNHAELSHAQCSAQGILNAFQVICQTEDYKYVHFFVPKMIADEVFAMPNLGYTKQVYDKYRTLIDWPRKSFLQLHATSVDAAFATVQMAKIDERGKPMYEIVDFNG